MKRWTLVMAFALLWSCSADREQPAAMSGGTGGAGGALTGGNGGTNAGAGGSAGANDVGGGGAGGMSAGASAGGGLAGGSGGSGGSDALDAATANDAATDSDGGDTWTTRALTPGPSYMGSTSGGNGCDTSYATIGHAPVDPDSGKHPLFLYYVGTSFSDTDESSQYDSPAATTVTEAMARRGFVALSVDYDNSLSFDLNKAGCLYGEENEQSVLAVACALPEVDCELGVATWGHSQGAAMAHGAATYEPRVRAVWTTGYSGGSSPLSPTRLRVVNGENDTMNAAHATINNAAGLSDGECPDDGRSECLRADGSGWILVRQSACEANSADHCWFDKASCFASAVTLEPAWIDPASTAPFALEANADWVASTVARP